MKKGISKKQLIATGILTDFFGLIKKRKNWIFSRNFYAQRIANRINYLYQKNRSPDPAITYLKKLEKDYKKLIKTETHQTLLQPLLQLYDIEIKVGFEYCKKFRQKAKKEYAMDLFFLDLYMILRELKYGKRLEIITDIYLIMVIPDIKYEGWKNKHPDYFHKGIDNVKKRLKRITKYFEKQLKSPEFKQYDKARIEMLNELEGKKVIPPLPKTRKELKRYIRNEYLINLLQHSLKREKRIVDRINILELSSLLDSFKVKNHSEILNKLLDDREFMSAFQKF